MLKAKYVDYRVTRNAEDTELKDDDFAFVFTHYLATTLC